MTTDPAPTPPTEEPRAHTCAACGKSYGHDLTCPVFRAGLAEEHFNQLLADAVDAYRAAPTGGVEG